MIQAGIIGAGVVLGAWQRRMVTLGTGAVVANPGFGGAGRAIYGATAGGDAPPTVGCATLAAGP